MIRLSSVYTFFDEPRRIAIVSLAVAAFLIVIGVRAGWAEEKKVVEILLQFLLIVVLGGSVAYFYRQVEDRRAEHRRIIDRERESRAARRDALEDFHQSLVKAYHAAKKVRRTLRAVSFSLEDDECSCERRDFERLMTDLEEAQLQAEALVEEVEARPDLFGEAGSEKSAELRHHLKSGEKYLRKLLKQYEDEYGVRRQIAENGLLHLSGDLIGFTGHLENSALPEARNPERRAYYSTMRKARHLLADLINQSISNRG